MGVARVFDVVRHFLGFDEARARTFNPQSREDRWRGVDPVRRILFESRLIFGFFLSGVKFHDYCAISWAPSPPCLAQHIASSRVLSMEYFCTYFSFHGNLIVFTKASVSMGHSNIPFLIVLDCLSTFFFFFLFFFFSWRWWILWFWYKYVTLRTCQLVPKLLPGQNVPYPPQKNPSLQDLPDHANHHTPPHCIATNLAVFVRFLFVCLCISWRVIGISVWPMLFSLFWYY